MFFLGNLKVERKFLGVHEDILESERDPGGVPISNSLVHASCTRKGGVCEEVTWAL